MSNSASIKNFVDVGDPGAPIGSAPWCRASHVQLCAMKRKMDWEVRHLKYGLLEFKRDERWRQIYDNNDQPFVSWEDYVQYPEPNGLGMPPESLTAVLETLNDDALLGTVLGTHGGKRRGEDFKLDRSSLKYGTRDYWIARLDRDWPELAAKVAAKELSAKAAARLAGFIKKPTPYQELHRAWKKASEDDRRRFLNEVQ